MSLACFDTLVGLSKVEYDCFDDETPAGFDDSDSGYHLTDTDYGLTIIEQCAVSGWALLEAARTQAILEIKSDLRAKLRDKYDGALAPFSGVIAQLSSTGTQSVSRDFLGLRIRTKNQKGAKLVLKKIYLGLSIAGTYSVTITSNDPLWAVPTATAVVIATPNTMTAHTLTTPIELPLFSRTCEGQWLEYYISFDRNGATPRNNKITCCGNQPTWKQHLTVSGFESTDNEATDGQFSSMAFGMALDAYLACEELDWICEAEELGGYHLKDVVARTLQMRGAAIAISAMVDQFGVNPCISSQYENLNSRRSYLNKRSAENVDWISQNVPRGVTDCFTCKPQDTFHRSKTLV